MMDAADQNRKPDARWRKLIPSFLVLCAGELLLAALVSGPLAFALGGSIAHRSAISELARGNWVGESVNLFLAANPMGGLASGEAGEASFSAAREASNLIMVGFLGAAIAPVAVVLHALLYTFVAGAALARLCGHTGGIWRAGVHWYWPMFRLGLFLLAAMLLTALGGLGLLLLPLPVAVPNLIRIAFMLLLLAALGSIFELARAAMVITSDRSALRGLRKALGLLASSPGGYLGLWALLFSGNVLLGGAILLATAWIAASNVALTIALTLFTLALGPGYKLLRLLAQYELTKARLLAAGEPGTARR